MSTNVKCQRCNRTLKNPKYVDLGYGKICLAKIRLELKQSLEQKFIRSSPIEIELDPAKIGRDLAKKFR
jgi:hypothetical protein